MIGIGSDSMKPTISKGDAVILEKINDKTNLKKGDIIAYSNGKLIIVHRINEVNISDNDITYTMKGDANNGNDPRKVSRNQIKGKVVEINEGAVNGTVKIDIGGGNVISSVITMASIKELGLAVGKEAYAVIKASSVMVGVD